MIPEGSLKLKELLANILLYPKRFVGSLNWKRTLNYYSPGSLEAWERGQEKRSPGSETQSLSL